MKVVIVGNSDFSLLLLGYIQECTDWEIAAFSAEAEFISDKELKDIPVISYEEIDKHYSPEQIKLVLAVGYGEMGDIRKKLYEKYVKKGYEFINFIHPAAIVPSDLKIGTGNVIMEGVIVSRQCNIGNANMLFNASVIGHDNAIGDYNTFSGASTSGYVTIKNNCFLGGRSEVRDGVSLDSYVLVGACSYVDKDLSENSVILPAKSVVLEGKGSRFFMKNGLYRRKK